MHACEGSVMNGGRGGLPEARPRIDKCLPIALSAGGALDAAGLLQILRSITSVGEWRAAQAQPSLPCVSRERDGNF